VNDGAAVEARAETRFQPHSDAGLEA